MKPTIKNLLAVASLAFIGLTSMMMAPPAMATVRTCKLYVPPPGFPNNGYPANTNNLYFCFPTAVAGTPEDQLQLLARNTVASALSGYTTAIRANMQSRNINYYIFYNGRDAFDTLAVNIAPPEVDIKDNESGRSWIFPNNTTNKTTPVVSAFIWTNTQYANLHLNTRTPTTGDLPTAQQNQLSGTVRHESGHHLSRVWAQQLSVLPLASSTIDQNYVNWGKALNMDGSRLSAQAVSDLETKYSRFAQIDPITHKATGLKGNEIFAELIAMYTGGGAVPAEAPFLTTNFPCARWYTQQGFFASNGLTPNIGTPKPPTAPAPGACYGNTNWNQP